MSTFVFSSPIRILLGSDNPHLVSALSTALLNAGFDVQTAQNYNHLEELWHESQPDIVLLEVSHAGSIEPATASALRIKGRNPQQFIAYLADNNLRMSGLTGDAIFSRNTRELVKVLREVLQLE